MNTGPGDNVTNEDPTQKDVKLWIGRAAMFTNGFVMLTPHRIALSCTPHVVKRFHLPPDVVPLFIYKIHNPMELASLSSTFLANVVSWVNEATINSMYLKRYLSIIFLWLMTLCSVMTYYLFISGDDFGYLDYFYWNMIHFTFINGFASSFGFSVNFNTSMYGAGLPTSGGFTFVMHFLYKWLHNIYYWEDYDYKLVVYQIKVTMILLFFNSVLWTGNELLHIMCPYYPEWYVRKKVLIANGVYSSNGYKVGKQGDTEGDADDGVRRIANVMNNADSSKASWFGNGTVQNAIGEIVKPNNDNEVKIAGLAALVIFGSMLTSGVIVGKPMISEIDINDEDIFKTMRNLGGYFALTSLIPIFFGVVIANHREKATLGPWTTIDSDKTVLKSDLSTGTNAITGFGKNANETQHHAKKFAVANFVASVGIGALMIVFIVVGIFSRILFKKNKELLLPVLFLMVFIDVLTACVFVGVIIVGSITIIGETIGKKSLVNGKGYVNGILLLLFLIVSIATGYRLILYSFFSYVNCIIWGFLIYGLTAAIISAVNVDGGIKKLFAGDNHARKDWSPIGMLSLSMGTVYAFYPSISPYQLVDDENLGKDIELWALLISSIPTFVIALLDIEYRPGKPAFGPNGRWYVHQIEKRDNLHQWWHLTWVFVIPYYLCIIFFFCIMHFPEGRIGRFFKGHSIRIALLSVTFNTVEETLEAVGFGGGGMQTGFNGPIVQFNVLLMLTIVNICMFTDDGQQTSWKLSM